MIRPKTLIVTSKSDEWEAIKLYIRVFGKEFKTNFKGGALLGGLPGKNKWHSILLIPPLAHYGQTEAAEHLMKWVGQVKSVKNVILVGTSGGIPNVVNLGDVVYSSRVLFPSQRCETARVSVTETPVSDSFLRIARTLTNKDVDKELEWMDHLKSFLTSREIKRNNIKVGFELHSKLNSGIIGTSSHKITDKNTANCWNKELGVVCIEQEAEGVGRVARTNNKEFFVVRSVSELIYGNATSKIKIPVKISTLIAASACGFLLKQIDGDLRLNIHSIPSARISELINGDEWIKGATNMDEDIHFSSYYVRMSTKKYLPLEFKDFGYESIIALYEKFTENYYIRKSEVESVSNKLIEKMLNDGDWFEGILNKIRVKCDELLKVFAVQDYMEEKRFVDTLGRLSESSISDIYKKHNKAHLELYSLARIPETLDRGIATFTNYLMLYLQSKIDSKNEKIDKKHAFLILTEPEESTIFEHLDMELDSITGVVKNKLEEQQVRLDNMINFHLYLPQNTKNEIEEYHSKIAYQIYHGLVNKQIVSLEQVYERIRKRIEENSERRISRPSNVNEIVSRKKEIIERLNIDESHKRIFEFYWQIGIVKAYRKYVQQRNFYLLDSVVEEISKRLAVKEFVIRNLSYDEVEKLLQNKNRLLEYEEIAKSRSVFCALIIDGNDESIKGGRDFLWIKDKFIKYKGAFKFGGTSLVSVGRVKGKAKIINNRADLIKKSLSKNEIMVSNEIGPELFEVLKTCKGVVTDQGGVTSHISAIIRGLHIPAIVGVEGILEKVHDNDLMDLDTESGGIKVFSRPGISSLRMDAEIMEGIEDLSIAGSKAFNLAKVKRSGYDVPEFFIIPLASFTNQVVLSSKEDAGSEIQSNIEEDLMALLDLFNSEFYSIRSSFSDEDVKDGQNPGAYVTLVDVEKADVPVVLREIINNYWSKGIPTANGSIIIQEMILGDVSGITYTSDPAGDQEGNSKMIIEVNSGGNEEITSGSSIPVRYSFDKRSESLDVLPSFNKNQGDIDYLDIFIRSPSILKTFTDLASLFNKPLDIEWTLKDGKTFILQARPIVSVNRSRTPSGIQFVPKSTASIYAYYRIPTHLRRHMLMSAALANLILDNWSGSQINRALVTKVLLTHDLGNIVKDPASRFGSSYSTNTNYWSAVRKSMIRRYGKDDHDVTIKIVRDELKLGDEVIQLLGNKNFIKNEETFRNKDYVVKLAAYCDQKIGPLGVMDLSERLEEAKVRYSGIKDASVSSDWFEELKGYGLAIEKQLQEFCSQDLTKITNGDLDLYLKQLKRYRFD